MFFWVIMDADSMIFLRQHSIPARPVKISPRLLYAVLLILIMFGCKGKTLEIEGREYAGLRLSSCLKPSERGNAEGLRLACQRHIEVLERRLSSLSISTQRKEYLETVLTMTRDIMDASGSEGFDDFLKQRYDFFQAGKRDSVLVTGYYTPLLRGSRTRGGRYQHPVYGAPDDLITVKLADFSLNGILRGRVKGRRLVPYYTRQDIENGIADLGKPLLYVDDRLELFFLQIQGSGIVLLEDGTRLRLNYSCGNGQPYTSIGRALIDNGVIDREDMSMEAIYEYFRDHPEEMDDYLRLNRSYVFFVTADDGPFGSTGAVVTAGRTIAADAGVLPELGIAFIDTEIPVDRGPDGSPVMEPYRAIVFHQDAGGAINGIDHVDLYFGEGEHTGFLAGNMKGKGSLYYLMPKDG